MNKKQIPWWINNPDLEIFSKPGMPFLEANKNYMWSISDNNYYPIIEQLWAIREKMA